MIKNVSALPAGSEADGAKKYACPATTLVGAVPVIVGGAVGGAADCAAATVIRKGPIVATPTPSETLISISPVMPTSPAPGVPWSSPVAVLNAAQPGILVMLNVSAVLSASETLGV
jgi:hypothetical protein